MLTTHAHKTFGDMLLQAYPAALRQQIEPHLQLYHFGLHGPDVLMYYKALTKHPVNRLGSAMHDVPGKVFFENSSNVVKNASGVAKQQSLAYVLGFLSHFVLDSVCHGYVEKKIQVSGFSHTQIEMELDRYLLQQEGKDPVKQKLTGHLCPSGQAAKVIAPFFVQLDIKQVRQSLYSMVLYLNLLRAPNAWKRRLISLAFQLTGNTKGMSGLVMSETPEPGCADSNLRLAKLMKKALPLCLRLTQNYLDHLQGAAPLDPWFDRTFSANEGWQNIPVYSFREEMQYETEIDIP